MLIAFMACDSVNFDDGINADDDAVTEPNTQSLMAAAMNDFFTGAGRTLWNKPTLYTQYQSQYQYIDEMCYAIEEGSWTAWYRDDLKNLDKVARVAGADKVSSLLLTFGAPKNQVGVSKIFSTFIWKRLTDTYGPVPYKNALSDSVIAPSYTPQGEIYPSLISTLKAARDMLEPSKLGPTGDVVYGGDVLSWQKFANSLLMSLAIQMSEANPNAAAVFKGAYDNSIGYIDEISEEMWYNYQLSNGAQNPYSQVRRLDYSISNTLVDAMQGLSASKGTTANPVYSSDTHDSRLELFADDVTPGGRPYGLNSQKSDQGPYAAMSLEMTEADKPLHFMTAAYTMLNIAEAAALGWIPGGDAKAADMLEQAIIISFQTLDDHYIRDGTLAAKGAAFAAARVADIATAPGGVLQVIREEKWISLFPRSFQPWAEQRRTGVPGLIPAACATNEKGQIPERYLFPSGEAANNSTEYKAGLQLLSPAQDKYFSTFWWNQ